MARASKADTTRRNPSRGEAAIQEFANTNSAPELLRQRAALLLDSKELLQNIRRLTPEGQTKFLEKADQVCHDPRRVGQPVLLP